MFNTVVFSLKNLLVCTFVCCLSITAFAQPAQTADTALTLDQCIAFALKNEPSINQALINEAITRVSNKIALAGWLPQANFSGNFTHYLTLPTTFIRPTTPGGSTSTAKTGVVNTVNPIGSVTQTIFNPSLLYAADAAPLYVRQSQQITDSAKIDIVAAVSKTFYSLLLTLQQIDVLKEDTARLTKNVNDAYHQYVSGIVDKTDYNEAVISLNNSIAQLKQATESVTPQYALLKQVMGLAPERQFNVSYDTLQMKQDIVFDTTQQLQYERRIEYQMLHTNVQLQQQLVRYYKKSWLPTVGAFFDYDYEFENNTFGGLFSKAYPYSYVGLSVTLPIFTGFARTNNIKKAQLQERLLDWDEVSLRSQIYSQYTSALATYKSNLVNLDLTNKNRDLAKETYDIVNLQYLQGVVPYLNVITAESNLITSEIGYQNALFTLLSSKIDLQRAMGIITVKN